MPLLPPKVLAPISACSTEIILQGTVPGASVLITAATVDDRTGLIELHRETVARGRAESSEQTFRLSRGVTLNRGQIIRAIQRVAGDVALESEEGIRVMRQPERELILPLIWMHRIREGTRCIRLEGAWPGAIIEVKDRFGHSLGRAQTANTTFSLTLSRPVETGEILTATQSVCGIEGERSDSLPARALPRNFMLPPPTVVSPLYECQRDVLVSDVMPGATVQVMRSESPAVEACFDAAGVFVPYSEADRLVRDEIITARQGFPERDLWSEPSERVKVLSARGLPRPGLISPICSGANRIVGTNLERGAIVRIYVDGSEIGYTTAASSTNSFWVPPLHGMKVSITQELCGFRSLMSEEISIEMRSDDVGRFIVTPISRCSPVVHVRGLWAGTRVRLVSVGSPADVLGETTALSDEVTFHVPTLYTDKGVGYQVEVTSPCSPMPFPHPVTLGTEVLPPRFDFYVLDCDRKITVNNVRSAALVDIRIRGVLIGSEFAISESVEVPIFGDLRAGDQVIASQRLCGLDEAVSSEETIRACSRMTRVGPKVLELGPMFMSNARLQLNWMRKLYRYHGFEVQVGGIEWINRSDLKVIDEDNERQWRQLLPFRNGLSGNDIALYFVTRVTGMRGSTGGFSLTGEPWGICQAYILDEYTAAHETGHALSLNHYDPRPCPSMGTDAWVGMQKRLMLGGPCRPTSRSIIPGNRPTGSGSVGTADEALIPSELATMRGSRYARPSP